MIVTFFFLWNESDWKFKSVLATLLLTISPLAKTADAKHWGIFEMPYVVPEKWREFASHNLLECPWPHDVAFVTIWILGSGQAGTPNYLSATAVFFRDLGDYSLFFYFSHQSHNGTVFVPTPHVVCRFQSLCRAKDIEIKHWSLA